MRPIGHWLSLCLLSAPFVLNGCSTMKVDTDHDSQANFAQYRTYAWAPENIPASGASPIAQNTLFEKRVKDAVNEQLPSRGLRQVTPSEHPDLLLYFHGLTGTQIASTDSGFYGGYHGAYPWGFGGYWSPGTFYQYKVGSIVLDLVDPRTQQLVWRGVATDTINQAGPSADQVRDEVKALIAEYPPKTGDQKA